MDIRGGNTMPLKFASVDQADEHHGRPTSAVRFWRDTMSTSAIKKNGLQSKLLWAAVIALGVASFAIIALSRGESINAAWLVIASVCTYAVAYRFYGLFIANKVLGVNGSRQTPA
jgi:hypothetical protein